MIKKFEFYHGAFLTRLIHSSGNPVAILPFPTSSNASYILNNSTGIYIKHSLKRLTPWRFTMKKEHWVEILQMKSRLHEIFLVLVCGDDGIVALDSSELEKILDKPHKFVEWISVARNRRKEYVIKGSGGELDYKVSKHDFSRKILEVRIKAKRELKVNVSARASLVN